MVITDKEKSSVLAFLFGLNQHKESIITIDFNNERVVGGMQFDQAITKNIKDVLTKVIKEQYEKQ